LFKISAYINWDKFLHVIDKAKELARTLDKNRIIILPCGENARYALGSQGGTMPKDLHAENSIKKLDLGINERSGT